MTVSLFFAENEILYYIKNIEEELVRDFTKDYDIESLKSYNLHIERYELKKQFSGDYLLAYDIKLKKGIEVVINQRKIGINKMKNKVIIEYNINGRINYLNLKAGS